MKKILAFALPVVAVAFAWSPLRVCRGFLPENDMRIPWDAPRAQGGLGEEQFNSVLDRIDKVYAPIIASKGGKLQINRLWKDATVNASATQSWSGTWVINMYGGLARHPAMTEEGMALVACHELGHHIGGAPKLNGWMQWLGLGKWATNEGGADYFATLKCLRQVMPGSSPDAVEKEAVAACQSIYQDPSKRADCLTGAIAGQSVAFVFQALRGSARPRFETPDRSVVAKMYDGHPEPQCRLDTYFQGALCPKPIGESVDDRNVNAGACTRALGYAVGLRPQCWYLPPASEPKGPSVASALRVDGQGLSARMQSMGAALQAQ